MIPWISVTSMILPFFAISFFIQVGYWDFKEYRYLNVIWGINPEFTFSWSLGWLAGRSLRFWFQLFSSLFGASSGPTDSSVRFLITGLVGRLISILGDPNIYFQQLLLVSILIVKSQSFILRYCLWLFNVSTTSYINLLFKFSRFQGHLELGCILSYLHTLYNATGTYVYVWLMADGKNLKLP